MLRQEKAEMANRASMKVFLTAAAYRDLSFSDLQWFI